MYIVGFALLFIGFLLCLSVAWTPIGFFAMSFGLISLLIVEDRSKASKLRLKPRPVRPSLQPRSLEPNASTDITTRQEGAFPDKDRWRLLVEHDSDLARVEKILSQYGPQYVDQLARVYVVFENKDLLSSMLKMIIESTRLSQGASEYSPEAIEGEEGSLIRDVIVSDAQSPHLNVPSERDPEVDNTECQSVKWTDHAPLQLTPAAEEISRPAANADGTDELMNLFEKLVSSNADARPALGPSMSRKVGVLPESISRSH